MERSEEIRRVVHRWMTAISAGDSASALGRLSEHPWALTELKGLEGSHRLFAVDLG